ncbi:MAG: sensor histidine kinase [Armatimonadota bacterium]
MASFYAPAERASAEALQATRQAFLANDLAVTLLEAIPALAFVLNRERQIIAANTRFRQALNVDDAALLGLRPGEAVGCLYACDGPGGCGTGRYCLYCGAVDAILAALDNHDNATRECRILTRGAADGGMLELEVQASFFSVTEHELVVAVMRDISGENRRRLLERIFFHDVLNTVSSISMVSQLLESVEEGSALMGDLKQTLARLTKQVSEEIVAQQQLLAAEQGDLQVMPTEALVADILCELQAFSCNGDPQLHGRIAMTVPPDCRIVTDLTILRRVLVNLVKNALEATPGGETIDVTAEQRDGEVTFHVTNPGIIPEEIQRQIFLRSFSTKGGQGRGIGTYSVKLLTERYLGGSVAFVSREPEGTRFTVTLPASLSK